MLYEFEYFGRNKLIKGYFAVNIKDDQCLKNITELCLAIYQKQVR